MKVPAFLLIAVMAMTTAPVIVCADPTTAPSTDDTPAPAAMAPTYIAIGKELLLRVTIVRRTLGELTLDAPTRTQATAILDDAEKSLWQMLHDVKSGNMPTYGCIMAVPQNMRLAHQKLLAVLGPDNAQRLDEKLRSLRGEGRGEIAKLRQELEDKNLSTSAKRCCDAVLADADSAVEKLPDMDVEGDQYAADRQAMDHLVSKAQSDIETAIKPVEQSKVDPSTRPAPKS